MNQMAAAGRALLAAILIAVGLVSAGCDTCPFQVTSRRPFGGTLQPGAAATHDVTIAREDDLQVDLASTATGGGGRADAWITAADCERLFDTPPADGAPAPTPRCTVVVGPVAQGAVSGREKVSDGRFRIHVYAYSSNTSAAAYSVELGTWGRTCRALAPF